jgi:hypothetical protein
MGRKRDTVDIISALVALCTPTISISLNVDNGDGTHTLSISNTYWLRLTKIIDIGGVNYLIESFIINKSITVSPVSSSDPPPSVSSFVLPKPHFIHGTTEEATVDQQEDMAANNRTPFVYLIEPLPEKDIKDIEDPWGRESRPRLYFMDESIENWNPPTHKTNVIEPIRQMMQLFFDKIADEEDNLYKEILEIDSIAAPNWGKFVTNKGYEGKFFSDTISGLQVDFDFTMSKDACEDIISATECPLQIKTCVFPESAGGANDGKIGVSVFNGIGNISFLWTGPSITPLNENDQEIESLAPGIYVVTVTDDNTINCSRGASATVASGGAAPTCDISISEFTITPPSIEGATDGEILATIIDNTGLAILEWNNGVPVSTANPVVGLGEGNILLIAVDNGISGCFTTRQAVMPDGPFSRGNCLDFNGINQGVNFDLINISDSEDFAVNVWLTPNVLIQAVILCGDANDFISINTATQIRVSIDGVIYDFTVPSISTGVRLMVSVSRISGTLRVYTDAVESTTGGQTSTEKTFYKDFGTYGALPSLGFDGLINELAIRDQQGITSGQITSLYASGGGANFNKIIGESTAYWRLNESGTDTIAVDENGNYPATLNANFPASGMWVSCL